MRKRGSAVCLGALVLLRLQSCTNARSLLCTDGAVELSLAPLSCNASRCRFAGVAGSVLVVLKLPMPNHGSESSDALDSGLSGDVSRCEPSSEPGVGDDISEGRLRPLGAGDA